MKNRRVEKIVKAVRERYGIVDRPFTRRDFYAICEAEGIRIIGRDVPDAEKAGKRAAIRGCLMKGDGWVAIYLACFWEKRFDLRSAFHELGHFFCGHTGNNFMLLAKEHRGDLKGLEKAYRESTEEIEADLFARLCTGRRR